MTSSLVKIQSHVRTLKQRREQGATAVEYGLMVALIAIVIIAAVALIGDNLQAVFQEVANSLA